MPEEIALTAPDSAGTGQADITQDSGQEVDTPTETDGQATSADTDTFSSIDPATLPEELKGLHKQLQADYTRKTQEIAELRKNADMWREQADAFNALMSNDSFTRLLEGLDAKAAPSDAQNSLTGEDLLTQIIENPNKLNELIDERAKQLVQPLADDIYGQRAAKEYEALVAKYPDLPQYEEQIATKIEQSNFSLSPEEAYRIVTYDKAKQAGINEGMQAAKKRDSIAAPAGAPSAQPTDNFGSIREAIQAAFRQGRSS